MATDVAYWLYTEPELAALAKHMKDEAAMRKSLERSADALLETARLERKCALAEKVLAERRHKIETAGLKQDVKRLQDIVSGVIAYQAEIIRELPNIQLELDVLYTHMKLVQEEALHGSDRAASPA